MICPKCGQESSGKFCPRCGSPLEAGQVQEQVESSQVQQAQETPANAATTEPIVAGGETATAGAEAGVAAGEAQQTPQEAPQNPYGQAQQTQEAPQSPYGQAQQTQEAPQGTYGQAQQAYGAAPQGVPPQPAKEPWYGKTWVIVLFLLFFWPVGIVLMWMKSCKWAKGAKIGVTVALAVLVIGGIALTAVTTSQLINATTRSPSASISSSASKSSSASSSSSKSSSSKSSSSSASTKSNSSQSNSTITTDCIDGSGNPSLYAISQLDGKSIKQMLEEHIGYAWDNSEGGWVYSKDNTVFAVMNQTSTLGKSDIEKLSAAGGDTPLVYVATLAGVKTLDQALNEGHVVVEDKVVQSDGSGVAVFYGPNMQEMMVVGSPDTNNTNYGNFSLLVFNRKAFESGLASEKLGAGSQGMSMEQFWQTMTGRTLNN